MAVFASQAHLVDVEGVGEGDHALGIFKPDDRLRLLVALPALLGVLDFPGVADRALLFPGKDILARPPALGRLHVAVGAAQAEIHQVLLMGEAENPRPILLRNRDRDLLLPETLRRRSG